MMFRRRVDSSSSTAVLAVAVVASVGVMVMPPLSMVGPGGRRGMPANLGSERARTPSPEIFAASEDQMGFVRAEPTAARRGGRPRRVDRRRRGRRDAHRGDERPDLLKLANEPGVPYSAGRFSSLTAAAVDNTSRAPELVFARPAAGWRRDRPGGWGRASRWSTRSPGTGRGRIPRGDRVGAAPPLRRQPDRAFA